MFHVVRKVVYMMRKITVLLLILILALLCSCASADTAFTFEPIWATASFPEGFILLTPKNLSGHQEWLTANNKDQNKLLSDWEARGVLVQAWSPDADVCIEVSAIKDEDAIRWFDIDEQSTATRASYRKEQSAGESNKVLGYTIVNAEWKKYTFGRFLLMQYKKIADGNDTAGYLRRTIRNGYSITIDYQVLGRSLSKSKDLTAINNFMKTFTFTQIKPIPATTVGKLEFTSAPPEETNTGKFTVQGVTTEGVELTGTLMRMADPSPIHITDVAKKNGKFSLSVELPTEGIWLMTVTVERDGTTIAEQVFEPTTYQKDLLPVNLDTPIPEQFTGDETVISGKTIKNVSVQCIVTTPTSTYDKLVKTNNSGTFKFKVPTAEEAEYNITLVFQKKNYSSRRFTYTAIRELTENDIRSQVRQEAVKPAYSTLTKKIAGYTGKKMVYNVWITDIQQAGNQWVVFAAMNKTGKGSYKNKIIILSDEDPQFTIDSQIKFYGTCAGTHQIQSEEGNESLPCFELLFTEN